MQDQLSDVMKRSGSTKYSDGLKQHTMTMLYSLQTNSGRQQNPFVSNVFKFFYSEKVEIKQMSGLPVLLLHHKFEDRGELAKNTTRQKEYVKYCSDMFK
jgi:hypothetical protein